MKLLTFLGTGNYTKVNYIWGNKDFETEFFLEAIAEWLKPAEIVIFLTTEAKQHRNWAILQQKLAGKFTVSAQDIPSGKSEAELWEIFEVLTKCLNDKDEIIFDITHAFRSLPILSLLAVSYLRVARSIDLKAMLYGAFEAKDEENHVPVFDLTPFLMLQTWVTATDKFIKTGDSKELAQLLKDAHKLPWKSATKKNRQEMPQHLEQLGVILENLSNALALTRPAEIAKNVTALGKKLTLAEAEATKWAKPFTLLLEQTRASYGPFAVNSLLVERELIEWYFQHGHFVQAITLAREWLVSWTCRQLSKGFLEDREEVTSAINQLARQYGEEPNIIETTLFNNIASLLEANNLLKLWSKVRDLRNDVAHCGIRTQPKDAKAIIKAIEEIVELLKKLSLSDTLI